MIDTTDWFDKFKNTIAQCHSNNVNSHVICLSNCFLFFFIWIRFFFLVCLHSLFHWNKLNTHNFQQEMCTDWSLDFIENQFNHSQILEKESMFPLEKMPKLATTQRCGSVINRFLILLLFLVARKCLYLCQPKVHFKSSFINKNLWCFICL